MRFRRARVAGYAPPVEAAHSLPASELLTGPRRGGDEDKGPRLACIFRSGHRPRRADAGGLAGRK